jgi:transposase InsO family protein
VAVLLRPGKTPSGCEIRAQLRRLVRLIRQHWPKTHLTIRGDGHYGRPEVMAWCEEQGIDYVFGLPGNDVLRAAVEAIADGRYTLTDNLIEIQDGDYEVEKRITFQNSADMSLFQSLWDGKVVHAD